MRWCTARGAGVLSSAFGLLFFLLFLLGAVQLLYSLYVSSVVTDAAYSAARHVAGHIVDDGPAAEARARARFDQAVGALEASLVITYDGDDVVVRVQASPPGLLPPGLGEALPYRHIDRTIRVRIEDLR